MSIDLKDPRLLRWVVAGLVVAVAVLMRKEVP